MVKSDFRAESTGRNSPRIYRIGLVTCASNFERHQIMIHAFHQALKKKGPFALYVITNYGIYYGDHFTWRGEAADYSLLDHIQLDGCILESNLASDRMTGQLAERLRKRRIPVIAMNLSLEGVPSVNLKLTQAGRQLMKHLLEDRRCERIDLVMSPGHSVIFQDMLKVYREELEAHGLPYLPERIRETTVSIQNGRNMLTRILREEPDPGLRAVICVHDVCAIGVCMEAEALGIRIPEDLLVCSLNYSQNSMIFRPDITGVDRVDRTAVGLACDLLEKMIAGEDVPPVTHYEGVLRYGASTGSAIDEVAAEYQRQTLQQQAVNKIEMGGQVSRMMQFNDDLEKAESLEDWAQSLDDTLQDIGCQGFYCCLNHDDLPYIESNLEDHKTEDSPNYDSRMTVITGFSPRTGEIRNRAFPIEELVPIQPCPGDQFLVLPIHHAARSYGYMVYLNDDLPIGRYVFRIFQESLGASLDNLHKKMILKGNIRELDRLHMEDQMTGLFNRFALNRFAPEYIRGGSYTTVLADMDSLKTINDTYGHLAGNNAICMIAESLKDILPEGDLILRYGGDEFLILSGNTDPVYWERFKTELNDRLKQSAEKQKLPYAVGISIGYAICGGNGSCAIEKQIEQADRQMYENKRARKALSGQKDPV
ncbi:MAG: GGDEF domain-containing protein [Clostridia bacterium]|nr:GGDEF domain-containing protein [Clostridia bacterium]